MYQTLKGAKVRHIYIIPHIPWQQGSDPQDTNWVKTELTLKTIDHLACVLQYYICILFRPIIICEYFCMVMEQQSDLWYSLSIKIYSLLFPLCFLFLLLWYHIDLLLKYLLGY